MVDADGPVRRPSREHAGDGRPSAGREPRPADHAEGHVRADGRRDVAQGADREVRTPEPVQPDERSCGIGRTSRHPCGDRDALGEMQPGPRSGLVLALVHPDTEVVHQASRRHEHEVARIGRDSGRFLVTVERERDAHVPAGRGMRGMRIVVPMHPQRVVQRDGLQHRDDVVEAVGATWSDREMEVDLRGHAHAQRAPRAILHDRPPRPPERATSYGRPRVRSPLGGGGAGCRWNGRRGERVRESDELLRSELLRAIGEVHARRSGSG